MDTTNIFEVLQGTKPSPRVSGAASNGASFVRALITAGNLTEFESLWLVRQLLGTGKYSDLVMRAYNKYERLRKERELTELGLLPEWKKRATAKRRDDLA